MDNLDDSNSEDHIKDGINGKNLTAKNVSVEVPPEIQIKGIEKALEGTSFKLICRELGLSVFDFRLILRANPQYNKAFQQARIEGYSVLADSLLDVPIEQPDPYRARLLSDNIKWLIGKRMPEVYGEKVRVELEVVDLQGALDAARSRIAVPTEYQVLNGDEVNSSNTGTSGQLSTDSESVESDIFS